MTGLFSDHNDLATNRSPNEPGNRRVMVLTYFPGSTALFSLSMADPIPKTQTFDKPLVDCNDVP